MILTILLIPYIVVAQHKIGSLTSTDSSIIRLSKDNIELRNKLNDFKEDTDKQYDRLSDQITFSSHTLTIFTFVWAAIAVILGIYITNIWDKIEKGTKDATRSKEKAEELYNLMQNNTRELYKQIKRKETENILERLESSPNDICNFSAILLSRDLEQKDFKALKNAFDKLLADSYTGMTYNNATNYCTIFFQHFPFESTINSDVREIMTDRMPMIMSAVFESDLTKSLPEVIKAYTELGIENNHIHINKLFSAVVYDFPNKETFNILVRSLKSKENALNFYQAIDVSQQAAILNSCITFLNETVSYHSIKSADLFDFLGEIENLKMLLAERLKET